MDTKILNFKPIGDARGCLISLEARHTIPFDIQRVYYIFDTKQGVDRGFHAHRELQQVAVAVKGACTMVLDDGASTSVIRLDDCTKGLYIGPGIWRVMKDFTEDCVLVVFASHYYDESDYIRDYSQFIAWINGDRK
jgi:dTDP-4-dehydrorhamnose 3,5-epimerase-like enzyme